MTHGEHSGYLSSIFQKTKRKKVVKKLENILNKYTLPYDGFVVTGVSGITMGSIMANLLNKELVVVRKTTQNCHADYKVENAKPKGKYIFLDDCISTGKTFDRVFKAMKKVKGVIIGHVLYDDYTPKFESDL